MELSHTPKLTKDKKNNNKQKKTTRKISFLFSILIKGEDTKWFLGGGEARSWAEFKLNTAAHRCRFLEKKETQSKTEKDQHH